MLRTKYFLSLLLLLKVQISTAQVGIGTTSPASSAQLDVTSSSKGFLPPRVALSSINDASTISSPATGLLGINTATAGTAPNDVTPGYYYYNGTNWQRLLNPSGIIFKKTILVNSVAPTSSISGQATISAWSASYTGTLVDSGDNCTIMVYETKFQ
jgi:hypothetical protein